MVLPGLEQLLDVCCLASLSEGSQSGHGRRFGGQLLARPLRELTPSDFWVLEGVLLKALLVLEALDDVFRLSLSLFEPPLMFS